MSANSPASPFTGFGLRHGRSASDQPIPSAVLNTPNSHLRQSNEGPSTLPRLQKRRQRCYQIPDIQTNQSRDVGRTVNSFHPSLHINIDFNATIPSNLSYPSPQVEQLHNAGLPYRPTYQSRQENPFHNTCTLFTNPIATQAHNAGLRYHHTNFTDSKHWYFLVQITIPPPSIMSVRHDMTPRQRAKARLHQLTINKRSVNEQRNFIRGSVEKMEARLEVLEVSVNHAVTPRTC